MKTNAEVPQAEELRFLMKSLVRDGSEELIGQTKDLTSSVDSLKKKVIEVVEGYETIEDSLGVLQKRISDIPDQVNNIMAEYKKYFVDELRRSEERIQVIETRIKWITLQLDEKHEKLEKSVILYSENQAAKIKTISEEQVKIQTRRMIIGCVILSVIFLSTNIAMLFI